jgi:hypothetical protein
MSDIRIDNGDCDFLSSKLIRHKQVQDLSNATEVIVTFADLSDKEAYYLLLFLRQDNAGYKIKSPISIAMRYELTSEKLNTVLAKDQEN